MKRAFLLTFSILPLLSYSLYAQEYAYTHYDITEGLAGSIVYSMVQDKDGFIWAATETGLSRFDGTHFRNYTTADGLPDIEILRMFVDSRGRVWMAPFRKSVCYYYKGKIFNQDNDPQLHKLSLKKNIGSFAEDREGNILLQEETVLHLLTGNGLIRNYDSIGNHPITSCLAVSRNPDGHFWIQDKDTVYEMTAGRFTPKFGFATLTFLSSLIAMSARTMISRESLYRTALRSFSTGKIIRFPFDARHFRHVNFRINEDSLVYWNESVGATQYNLNNGHVEKFLPGIEVSDELKDDEGNTWFATIGQGIYRLNSAEFKSLSLLDPHFGRCSVHAIQKVNGELLLGTNRDFVSRFSLPELKTRGVYTVGIEEKNRVMMIEANRNYVFYGSEFALDKYPIGKDYFERQYHSDESVRIWRTMNLKSYFRKSAGELLIANYEGVFSVDLSTFRVNDTLFKGRATAVYSYKDTTYVGTLNGVYRVSGNRSLDFLGARLPFFKNRISSIAGTGDGTLWVAAYDGGIACYRNGEILTTITRRQGLSSNICRTILVNHQQLWVGTDKGLNRIDLDRPGYPVTRYTSNDGLGSDIINTIYLDSSMVYVGTPAGLSYFDVSRSHISSGCRLALLAVLNSDSDRIADTNKLALSYKRNNIRFEYAGISYRSVDNINYKYRMLGLDTSWRNTKETFIEYPSLPSGDYEWQLLAINKFGIQSRLLSLHFTVTTPFWRTAWFAGLLLLIFLSLTWLFVSWRIKGIRRRQDEKEKLSRLLLDTEQMALRAQMNPHFIFNCLNSIQQYIFDQDIFMANKYITGFARLIRATLHHSTLSYITLDDEMDFLSNYLSLEKLRFKEKMDYFIEVDPTLDRSEIYLPPMLIQPYVENSMRHGLRHKTTGKGHILISVKPVDGSLVFIIEDNGIGREQAARYKTGEHIEYQSRGMSLTADRIRLINMVYSNSIRIDVQDLKDEQGKAAGTRVVMEFPAYFNKSTPIDKNTSIDTNTPINNL